MKKLLKIFAAFCCVSVLFVASSCSWFVEGYNVDPNNPLDVPEVLLLPAVQQGMGLMYGADLAWYSSVFVQTQSGWDRQFATISEFYSLVSDDMNNIWIWGYLNALIDANRLIEKGDTDSEVDADALGDNPAYAGMGRVMTAMIIGQLTDSWGPIPFDDALQGDKGVTTPTYNTGQEIYARIGTLLDDAIANFNRTDNAVEPGGEDNIYGGDVGLWKKAAYALKARYAIHRSGVDGAGAYNDALAALNNAFTSNDDDMMIVYGTANPSEANPWFQFYAQRGDLRMGEYLVDRMVANDDPRLPVFAGTDAGGGYSGCPPANGNGDFSPLGALYGSVNSQLPLMTYAEAMFIKAEALLGTGGSATAVHDAFEAAIKASCERSGISSSDADAYFTAIDPGTVTLKDIMEEKHVALFTQFESWTDYRRTGYPALTPATGTSIPSRLPYPQREIDLNPNTPSSNSNLFDKLWWDVN
jgi:hypothetical protein